MNNGFYGSLSKIQKVNFQFDRIFPNRAMMDQEAEFGYYIVEGSSEKLPPVFNGRYVLVDYHEGDVVDKTIRIGYKYGNTIVAAPGISFGDSEGVTINDGDRITVIGEYDENENYTSYDVPKLYEYPNLQTPITYTSNTNSADSLSTYEKNLMIDGQQYGNIGRGWDSTVWQKTYQNGKSTYIMIAELNAFNPTLAIAPDAPAEIPSNPYIGTDSTLDFYRIHMQAPAGIRIKAAEELKFKEENNLNILVPESSVSPTPPPGSKWFSTDLKHYPSDVNGNVAYFDGEQSSTLGNLPLAIYFNKDGMNKHISKSDVGEDDAIQFNYTGRSGKKYFKEHVEAGDQLTDFSVDTYELSIMLPSLGESISKIYDLAYGGNRYYNTDGLHLYWNNPLETPSEGEGADFSSIYFTYDNQSNVRNLPKDRQFRNTDIYWNSKQGIRLFKKENGQRVFDQDGLNSLAGMINTAHDLMGMIIRDYDDLSLSDVRTWDPTKIYFVDGHYYYKTKKYTWTAYADQQATPKPLNEAYNQIHFLPSNLVREIVDPEDQNNIEIALTTDLDSSLTYFIDTAHDGTGHSQNVIYRESWEEYPIITDTETFDSDDLFKTKYINYIKVKDEDDLIDGAVYGIIAENNSTDSPQDEPGSGHVYYYYDVTNNTSGVYQKETGNFNKGVYYDLTNLDSYQINKEFYIPNVFYIYNKTTGKTRLATESSLYQLIGSHNYTSNNANYIFYRRVMSGSGTPVEEVLDAYEWKRQTVLADSYIYENGTLIIYEDSSKSASIESIRFISADDPNNKNGIDNIEFDLNNNPIYYWTEQYTNSDKIYYYTKEELFQQNLNPAEWNIKKHLVREVSGDATGNIIIPDASSLISSLVDFEEGKYFYLYSGRDTLVLENFNRLRTSEGRVRSETHAYYEVNLPSLKKVFQTEGGSYYKTVEGDYKLYPTPNMKDPYEDVLTDNGKPLYGETKQIGRPIFIPLGNINKFRIFKPNMYYTSTAGSLATEFVIDNQHEYYERVGNIIGNSEPTWADGLEWNQLDVRPNDGILGQYILDWEAKEIKGLGEETNTMFGLILKINRLLEGENKNTRDSSSVQGIINQCKDTLAMMKSFGFAFNGFQVKDNDGAIIGNELVANTPGDKVELISNNSLINLNIDTTTSKQIRFDETVLNAETDDINNITYLNIGDVAAQTENPQIIEYPKNINANTDHEENIKDLLTNNRDTDLAFNANDVAFYGPNEELTKTEIKYFEPAVWTNSDPNDNTQWVFNTTGNSLTVNSSNLNFILNLLSDTSSNRKTDFVNYSHDWTDTMILQGSLAEDLTSYTFSQANLDVILDSNNTNQANITFSLELNAPLTDLPENGITHAVKLTIYDSNNSSNVYYTVTKNIEFVNNSTVFAIQDFSVNLNVLKNGKINFVFDNDATLLTNSDSTQYNTETSFSVWNSSFIVIPGNNHILALTDGEEIVYYQRNDFSFGTPGSPYTIGSSSNNTVSFASNPDGKKVVLSIDGVAIQTWNSFSMPVTPPPVKVGEFKSTGQLNLYKGLCVNGSNRATHEGKPFITSTPNYPLHLEWEPEDTGREITTTTRTNFSEPIPSFTYIGPIGTNSYQVESSGGSLNISSDGIFRLKLNYNSAIIGEALNGNIYLTVEKNTGNLYFEDFTFYQAMTEEGYTKILSNNDWQNWRNGNFSILLGNYSILSTAYGGIHTSTTIVGAHPARFTIYNDNNNTPLIKIEASTEETS